MVFKIAGNAPAYLLDSIFGPVAPDLKRNPTRSRSAKAVRAPPGGKGLKKRENRSISLI